MAITNKSSTPSETKDYWRTSPELVDDALRLLGVCYFDTDVCCSSSSAQISKSFWCITEKENALSNIDWFSKLNASSYCTTSFCNPPFSRKWMFFQKAVEQSKNWGKQVLMILPYTPCTKEWADNVHSTNCIIYVPDGRYQYLLPDGSKPKSSCNFETCLILIVPFKCGNVTVNYKRGSYAK